MAEGGTGGGILGRLFERILGWIALALLLAAAFGIYRLGPVGRQALLDGFWKALVWLMLVATLPWTARFYMSRLLEFRTNWAGLILLAAFVLVEALVGLLLLGGWPSGGWSWFAALAALAVAGTYNFLVAEYLAEQAGP